MMRFITTAALVLTGAAPALTQDMPLSQILIDGEGWKKVEGKPEKSRHSWQGVEKKKPEGKGVLIAELMTGVVEMIVIRLGNGDMHAIRLPEAIIKPAGIALTPDGGTLFVGDAAGQYIWAFSANEHGLSPGAPYCPMRLERSKKASQVNGLTTDNDGRIYAATELGVQVFDPTGRLCGVLTPAAPGKPEHMAFEGDTLTLWIGDAKYARKLRTEGVK